MPERFNVFTSLSFVFFSFGSRIFDIFFSSFYFILCFARAACFVLFIVSWLDPFFAPFSFVIFFHHRLSQAGYERVSEGERAYVLFLVWELYIGVRVRCGYAFWRTSMVQSSCRTTTKKIPYNSSWRRWLRWRRQQRHDGRNSAQKLARREKTSSEKMGQKRKNGKEEKKLSTRTKK